MRVAFVNQPYDRVMPPGQNSIGLIVYKTALAMAGDVDVTLYGAYSHNPHPPDDSPFEFRGISAPVDDLIHRTVRDHPRWTKRFRLGWLADAHPQYPREARVSLDRADVDIVHIMNYWSWSSQLRGKRGRRRVVLEMQAEWLSQKNRRAVAAQLNSVDAVVGVSDHIVNLFRQSFPQYAGITAASYNGVDAETFRPPDECFPDDEKVGGARILFVGRVSPEKGIHTLLEAFARVVKAIPEARLDIVGHRATLPADFIVDISSDPLVRALERFYDGSTGGDYQRYLDETISRLGLSGSVRFLGSMPHRELVAVYQAADVVVNPSLSESFGIAIVEGMACGVPVVGTKIGGMLETIRDGETGFLVEPEEPEELARAIRTILGDRELSHEMALNGRKRVVEMFSWRARAQRLLDVYRALSLGEPVA